MSFIIDPYRFAAAGGGLTNPEVEYDGRNLTGADEDLIAQWDDSSGNARHATQSNDPQKPTVQTAELNGNSIGRWGGAAGTLLDFSGNTAPTAFTVIAVIKCTNAATTPSVLSANTGAIPLVRISTANKVQLVHADTQVLATSDTALLTTAFYTIAVTYDDPGATYAFYLNGSADGSGTPASTPAFARFSRVGCRNGNQNTFVGDIAYVALWNSILSGTELTTRFNDLQTVWAHY